mmetsp:Transcript_22562/g.32982  ORF Transcript_22562/g.32982 Transcript_22562/m.32982 type:complete len:386 (+) Transcript_22562:85-1242(+)
MVKIEPPKSLAELFSESSKANFARTHKPEEFQPKKRPQDEKEEPPKRVKKPKHKHTKKEQDEASDVAQDSTQAVDNDTSDEEAKKQRTVFVGNIPISATLKSVRKIFSEFGDIESIRMRSVPISGTAVDDHGNQNLVKKVCVNTAKFGDQKGSFNAYIVYRKADSVSNALSANNRVVGNRHLRVDRAIPTMFNPKLSVFLGSLPFYTDEEELRSFFAEALPNGQEDIEGIRVVRDPNTLIGKGIGYLALRNHDAVMKALSLDETKFKKRKIRVTTCGKRTKRSEKQKAERASQTTTSQSDSNNSTQPGSSSTNSAGATGGSKKRKRDSKGDDNPAVRRMKMKKALSQMAKKKSTPHQKVKSKKKLGGVIKTAMKAMKMTKKMKSK